jgi:hypothetical protein
MGKEREAWNRWLSGRCIPRHLTSPDMFVEWLCSTGDGAVVLERINRVPRQLFLPFQDDEQPWITSDE